MRLFAEKMRKTERKAKRKVSSIIPPKIDNINNKNHTNCNRNTVKRYGQKFMTLMLMNFDRGACHNEPKSMPF